MFANTVDGARHRSTRRGRTPFHGSVARSSIQPARARVAQPKTKDRALADSGGATPKAFQTHSRITTHRKLVYPSTGWKGGGFHTYP